MFEKSLEIALNNPAAWRLLRNRGRARAIMSSLISGNLKHRLQLFLQGKWTPDEKPRQCDYPVSLTSWGPRLLDLPLVLISLLQQSVRPPAIHVWLSQDDHKTLDRTLLKQFSSHGVHFEISDNLGPHTKWLPMIEHGAREPFVICDDDILYPPKWLESLIREDRSDAYVAIRCHQIEHDANGFPVPYSQWKHDVDWNVLSSQNLFVTACAGAILHPDRISDKFRNRSLIMELCPKADDIWLKAAHTAAGIPCYKTRYSFPCLELPGSFETSLLQTNVDNGGNDRQLAAVKQWLKQTGKYL